MISIEHFNDLSERKRMWIEHWHLTSHDYLLAPDDLRILFKEKGELKLEYYGVTAEFIYITMIGC